MSDYQTQAKICPFCHDDHSAMTCYENKLKQENARLREAFGELHTEWNAIYEEWDEHSAIEWIDRRLDKIKQALEAGDE